MSLAVMISGSGSNLQTLLDHPIGKEIKCVVSSNKSALGIYRSRRSGTKVLYFSRQDSWRDLSLQLKKLRVSKILLLGFMRLVPSEFIESFSSQVWNLHPSLLPTYPGLNSLERAFQDKAPLGVSFHKVDAGMDTGPLELQYCYSSWLNGSSELKSVKILNSLVEQRLVRFFCERWA